MSHRVEQAFKAWDTVAQWRKGARGAGDQDARALRIADRTTGEEFKAIKSADKVVKKYETGGGSRMFQRGTMQLYKDHLDAGGTSYSAGWRPIRNPRAVYRGGPGWIQPLGIDRNMWSNFGQ